MGNGNVKLNLPYMQYKMKSHAEKMTRQNLAECMGTNIEVIKKRNSRGWNRADLKGLCLLLGLTNTQIKKLAPSLSEDEIVEIMS